MFFGKKAEATAFTLDEEVTKRPHPKTFRKLNAGLRTLNL